MSFLKNLRVYFHPKIQMSNVAYVNLYLFYLVYLEVTLIMTKIKWCSIYWTDFPHFVIPQRFRLTLPTNPDLSRSGIKSYLIPQFLLMTQPFYVQICTRNPFNWTSRILYNVSDLWVLSILWWRNQVYDTPIRSIHCCSKTYSHTSPVIFRILWILYTVFILFFVNP